MVVHGRAYARNTRHMPHIVTPAAAADGATEKATNRGPAEQGMRADVIVHLLCSDWWEKKKKKKRMYTHNSCSMEQSHQSPAIKAPQFSIHRLSTVTLCNGRFIDLTVAGSGEGLEIHFVQYVCRKAR